MATVIWAKRAGQAPRELGRADTQVEAEAFVKGIAKVFGVDWIDPLNGFRVEVTAANADDLFEVYFFTTQGLPG